LLAMASQARLVLRKLGDILKGGVTFADFFPVRSGKLVTGIAGEALIIYMRFMGKPRVVEASFLYGLGLFSRLTSLNDAGDTGEARQVRR